MVRLAIAGETSFELSDCELQRKGVSYTFDTVLEFEKQYPRAQLFLILGQDSFEGIDSWYRAAELKQKVRFLVAHRGSGDIPMLENARVERILMPLCSVSASAIRDAIKRGQHVDDDLSPEVLRYIRAHALYGKD